MPIIRTGVFLAAITLSCLNVHACADASKQRVQKVLKESIRLNEAFKKSVDGSDDAKYRSLRKQVERYEESAAIPCLKRAVALLGQMPDESLLKSLFEHALSRENSGDETEGHVLASALVQGPDLFITTWRNSSAETQKAVTARVENGWNSIKKRYLPAKQKQIEARLKEMKSK